MNRKARTGITKEMCIACHRDVLEKKFCEACHKGPMCMNCMGNDIEHDVEDHPICEECIEITQWCSDCYGFIALPSEDPLIDGFLCEGYGNVRCGVLICEPCSYAYNDYFEVDDDYDEESPVNRSCEKCREGASLL